MVLTPEEKLRGQRNFETALGATRRDFLKAAVGLTAAGAFYFGYQKPQRPVRAGIIGTGDQGNILITESNPDYIEFIAYCDIRPSNRRRTMEGEGNAARIGFKRKYGVEAAKRVEERSRDYHEDYRRLLEDPDIEVVVTALPLHLHARVAIDAMQAGKHVFTEKLMARTVGEAKEMCRQARKHKRLLAVGHQRHYSLLYEQAVSVLRSGLLGDIRYVRALWHRNNTWPVYEKDASGKLIPKMENGRPVLHDSWRRPIPEEDRSLDPTKWGYQSLEELVRWRLYRRTGGGLLVELGSHQLDACSIFLGGVLPVAVSGVGVKSFYKDDREVDDHIFVTYEFPGQEYFNEDGSVKNRDDVRIVTYSSINTNALEPYGETIYGTRATLIVANEQEVYLFPEQAPGGTPPRSTYITVARQAGNQPVLESSATQPATPDVAAARAAVGMGQLSRGYREELEHFAYLVRNFEEARFEDLYRQHRCNGDVGLIDTVIALVGNLAMDTEQRIVFKKEWFDPLSDELPPEKPVQVAQSEP
jgi:predicted dehydrogenase